MSLLDHYDTAEAVKATGLSENMLDYLVREGIVRPSATIKPRARGQRRYYNFRDLMLIKVAKCLLDQHVGVSKMKHAFKKLEERAKDISEVLPGRYIVTDGKDVYFRDENQVLEDKNGQLMLSFVFDARKLRADLVDFAIALADAKESGRRLPRKWNRSPKAKVPRTAS